MALPTQFSVTTGKVSPIANPKAPTDLPKKLEAEEVNLASGASLIPSLSAADTDNPSQLTAESAANVGVPDSLTAQPITVTIAPDVLSAQPATITNNPDVLTALPVTDTGNPDVLSAQNNAVTPIPVTLTPNAGTPTAPPFALNHARVLYRNLLESYLSTSVTIGVGGDLTLIPNSYQRWEFTSGSTESITITLPANVDMDTFCIGSHNLNDDTPTAFKFSYSSSTSGGFTALAPFKVPINSADMVHISSPVSVRRLLLEVQISPIRKKYIGYISAGIALQMQRPFFNGHTPITDSDVTEYYSNRSESGEIIGQQIRRKGFETQAQWNNIDDGWYRSYFAPFKQYVKTRPFFFAWNLLEYPDDVGFCRINQDIRSPIQNGSTTKRTVNMTLMGAG